MATMYVYNIPTNETVNLRSSRDTSVSNVLVRVPYGAAVSATAYDSTWHSASYSGYSGYIMSMYLTATNPNGGGSGFPSDVNQNSKKSGYIATQTDPLTIRSGPGTGYGSVGSVPRNATVDYYTSSLSTSWYYVVYGSIKGYGSAQYILPSSGGGTTPTGLRLFQCNNQVSARKSSDLSMAQYYFPKNRKFYGTYKTTNSNHVEFYSPGTNATLVCYVSDGLTDLGAASTNVASRVKLIAENELAISSTITHFGPAYDPWCQTFVNWCARLAQAGSSEAVYKESGCTSAIALLGSKFWSYSTGAKVGTAGDWVYYKKYKTDGTAVYPSSTADHVGYILSVTGSGSTATLTTIEGNRNGNYVEKVSPQALSTTGTLRVIGFATPPYK